jgi:hypothetical protein
MGLHALHAALLGCGTLGFGPEAELGIWSPQRLELGATVRPLIIPKIGNLGCLR